MRNFLDSGYLERAIAYRKENHFFPSECDSAFRLFNGFTEHFPKLCIDIFAKTAVIHDFSREEFSSTDWTLMSNVLCKNIPFIKCIILKQRFSQCSNQKNGIVIFGKKPDCRIVENHIRYAIDLLLNQDNSFYCDTRLLRKWLAENMQGKKVLNTFAYTGSLGTASFCAGAENVIQTDISDKFLNLACKSYSMNHIYYTKKNFIAGNFFSVISKFKQSGHLFDCVILDPPFFSKTRNGIIDMENSPISLINKVRPIVANDGYIVHVNNSLYLSGNEYLNAVDTLCDGKYLTVEGIIPIPRDFTGYCDDYIKSYSVSPVPFNHPTKIIILKVKTK